jgi:hypothetical protein
MYQPRHSLAVENYVESLAAFFAAWIAAFAKALEALAGHSLSPIH